MENYLNYKVILKIYESFSNWEDLQSRDDWHMNLLAWRASLPITGETDFMLAKYFFKTFICIFMEKLHFEFLFSILFAFSTFTRNKYEQIKVYKLVYVYIYFDIV